MRDLFCEKLVPQLLYVRNPEDLTAMMSQRAKDAFPHLLYLIDATTFDVQKPGNFLLNRLTWSAYKGKNVFQVICGKVQLVSKCFYLLTIFLK